MKTQKHHWPVLTQGCAVGQKHSTGVVVWGTGTATCRSKKVQGEGERMVEKQNLQRRAEPKMRHGEQQGEAEGRREENKIKMQAMKNQK